MAEPRAVKMGKVPLDRTSERAHICNRRRSLFSGHVTVVEVARMNTTSTREALEQRPPRPRKIRLDCEVYCSHSMRASSGNADCDHDFDVAPTVKEAHYAVWNCTRCGRAFKYEIWSASPKATAQKPAQPRRRSSARNASSDS
jgi:ribosomal protein L37AE/L43A